MNIKLLKKIKRFVDLKIDDEGLPNEDREKLYEIFKKTFESATPTEQKQYKADMESRFAKEVKGMN